MIEFTLALLVGLAIAGLTLAPNQIPDWAPWAVGAGLVLVLLLVSALFHQYLITQVSDEDEHRNNSIG